MKRLNLEQRDWFFYQRQIRSITISELSDNLKISRDLLYDAQLGNWIPDEVHSEILSWAKNKGCIVCGMNIDPEIALFNTGVNDCCDLCAIDKRDEYLKIRSTSQN